LSRFLDQRVATDIMAIENVPRADVLGPVPPNDPLHPNKPAANTRAHWPAGSFGNVFAHVQSVVIHETSGWPSYASAGSFRERFRSLDPWVWKGPDVTGHWQNKHGVGPQYLVDANGTAFVLIGPQNLAGDARVTHHGESMNRLSVGIENGDLGDAGIAPPAAANGPRWFRLSTEAQDLPGRKAFLLLHPGGNAEDVNLIWIAQFPAAGSPLPRYVEPGDLTHVAGWDNMIFTERDYRTLVLLCRLVVEQYGIPRNFLILPYLERDDHTDPALFRRMILADQLADSIAQKLGTTTAVIQAAGAPYTNWYNGNPGPLAKWSRFFGADPANLGVQDTPCYKGFLSHAINGGHFCPGPFFDWHRFAREVWDWWWFPFDLDNAGAASTVERPYRQARRDTPLVDYFWDAVGTPAQREALRLPQSITETFRIPADTPIYAMANGVIVAARLPIADPATDGFLLVRHEVFHRGANGRIDYDVEPTFVWTLTYYLRNAGFSIPAAPPAVAGAGALPATNPDWLNRLIIRLRECELAVAFRTAHPANVAANAALHRGWAHAPSGAGPRLATGQEIERDATEYRAIATELSAGRVALFPLESQTAVTPVRVCLGDFLGFPGRIPVVDVDAVWFEIFSLTQLPVPNAVQTQSPVLFDEQPWWATVSAAARHEDPAGADLPATGSIWRYQLADFLTWVNNTTWASEWQKYDVTAAGGVPAPLPARPARRI